MRMVINQDARANILDIVNPEKPTKTAVTKALKSVYNYTSVKYIPKGAKETPSGLRQSKVRKNFDGKVIKAFETGVRYSPLDATGIKTKKVISLLEEMGNDLKRMGGVIDTNTPFTKSFIFTNGKKTFKVIIGEVLYRSDLNISEEYQNSYIDLTIVDGE